MKFTIGKPPLRTRGYLGLALLCLFYWLLDSIWSYFSFEMNLKKMIFSEPGTFLDILMLKVSPYQIVSRLMVVLLFILSGSVLIEFLIRKQAAEKARNETRKTLMTVLNSIDATIYVSDMETHKILFMNKSMIDTFGGDFIGGVCYKVFRKAAAPCDDCTNPRLLNASGRPTGVIAWEGFSSVTGKWHIHHDRAISWIDGRIVRLQIATDITELKNLQEKQLKSEAQLRQARKMESIGTLAGGIAHDFNNILAAVIGYTELAMDQAEKGSSIEDCLKEVYTAGIRARDLIKQIMTFSRKSDEQMQPIRVDAVAKETLRLIRSLIPTTIDIRRKIESRAYILGNPTEVHQIFMNLCTNAAQAMEKDGGVLEVGLTDVAIDADAAARTAGLAPGGFLKITVSDTGGGIPPDVMDVIFEPYFTTKGPGEGTGMGLATVHGIVKRYGGEIFAESETGKGSVFTIYLPAIEAASETELRPAGILPTGAERILVIDDEPAIAKMTSRILERLGYVTTVRTSSTEALALFRNRPDDFDLIVTDMTMPNMTGDKLAHEVMKIRPEAPVILCTGYSKTVSSESAAASGITCFAHKPLVKADFAKTVRDALDGAKQDRQDASSEPPPDGFGGN